MTLKPPLKPPAAAENAAMKTVLVADDKAAGRELMRTILEQLRYRVLEAGDGIEALRLCREQLPDLIILDIHMPGLDGFEVLEKLKADERFASTPIVALTASAMGGDRDRAFADGFTAYIAKPISLSDLRAELQRLLRGAAQTPDA